VAQTMYKYASKCKNSKIKGEKEKRRIRQIFSVLVSPIL
jgi:hypothetical protein